MALFKKFNSFRHNTAFICEAHGDLTYSDFIYDINYLGDLLDKKKLILIIADTSYETILAYVAATVHRAPVMFVDVKTSPNDINNLIKLYDPGHLFAPSSYEIASIKVSLKTKARTVKTYLEHYKSCEIEHKETPSSFMLEWSD